MDYNIGTIRDLINEPVIRGPLAADGLLWDRVCTAMDYLSDGRHLPDRIDAINVLAGVAGVAELGGSATESDVHRAIERVREGLEEVRRQRHRAHSAQPLEAAFKSFRDLGYALEKIAGVTGTWSDALVAKGYLDPLEQLITATRDGLNARGLSGNDMTQSLEFIVGRVRSYLDGSPGAPQGEDLDLIVRYALRQLMHELRDAAREADLDDSSY